MRRLLALLALFCLSCNPVLGVPSGETIPSVCRLKPDTPILETFTYNAGLAPGVVPYATPRIKPVAEELAKFRNVGIMCLQEVWTQEAKDAIVASLALPEDQVYYVDTRGQGEEPPGSNVCRSSQIGPVAQCVEDNCSDIEDPEETTVCANRMCKQELVSLYLNGGRDCVDCLVASVGQDLKTVEKQCTKPAPGITRAYGGQNGVMLISRWPLENREWEMLPASFSNRVALYATITLEKRQPLEVACTHLSTYAEMPPGFRDAGAQVFDDWDDEMIAQVSRISAKLRQRANGERPQLLIGDLNAGPEIGRSVSSSMPRVWRKIVALGFSSPAVEAERPFCSTCDGNSLRNPGAKNYLLDHVLMRDPVGGSRLQPRCVRSVLGEGHQRYFPGYDGRLLEEHLSDHYGVAAAFSYE
jgi:endonuclease/exonuclease/phosphatase family metal-dependent hydrolase